MTRTDFIDKIVARRLELITQVLAKKGDEYAGNGNAFHNFEEGTKLGFSITREKLAWEYMTKHLQSIKDMLEYPELTNHAAIEEKFGDAINYLILIEGMVREKSLNVTKNE